MDVIGKTNRLVRQQGLLRRKEDSFLFSVDGKKKNKKMEVVGLKEHIMTCRHYK